MGPTNRRSVGIQNLELRSWFPCSPWVLKMTCVCHKPLICLFHFWDFETRVCLWVSLTHLEAFLGRIT